MRADTTAPATIVSGDGEGLVDLSQSGLLSGTELLQYSASFAGNPPGLTQAVGTNSVLVVTDSNRKRAERWDNVNYNVGYTERPGEQPLVNGHEQQPARRVPRRRRERQTTVMAQQGVQVSATDYGSSPNTCPPTDPRMAFDGDVETAWTVGGVRQPSTANGSRRPSPTPSPPGRSTSSSRSTGSGTATSPGRRCSSPTRTATRSARTSPSASDPRRATSAGPDASLPQRRLRPLQITIDTDNQGPQASYAHASGVGFAEIRLHDDATPTQTST